MIPLPVIDYILKNFTALMVMMPVFVSDIPAESSWTTVASEAYAFSVKIPEGYEIEADSGVPYATYNLGAYAHGVSYLVSVAENPYPDCAPEVLLREQTEGLLDMLNEPGLLASSRKIRHKGHRGMELNMVVWGEDSVPGVCVTQRTFITNRYIYILGVGFAADDIDRKAERKFFRSFRLL